MKKSYIYIVVIMIAILGAYIYNLSTTTKRNEIEIIHMKQQERLKEVEAKLETARENFKLAEKQLQDSKNFKLLRTPNEKALQVKAATDIYNNWKEQVEYLENQRLMLKNILTKNY
ncbi:hypothetical protein DVK85_11220 [Flavobacterium arcticum]|uniref:Uncharacterized protein n=1 Tax=Flavobacterium arcticum TaxID=1784713 RepID=A0A345HDV9_9FLAO|nr:hypothetical protein [Flavobacterium arcticum]AXG74769.1 hypothetical protein DVK85_11220 [Flavobacterium arcticum]KAF2509731.1 hypothetical protein E0W72_09455 [Flavobacterium arcticum]